jgi:hypothetical protein
MSKDYLLVRKEMKIVSSRSKDSRLLKNIQQVGHYMEIVTVDPDTVSVQAGTKLYHSVSQRIFLGWTLTCLFISRGTPVCENKNKITNRLFLAHGDYCSISNCQTKIVAMFRNIFIIFFAVFRNSYVFTPLSLMEPLMAFCRGIRFHGTVFEKHCSIRCVCVRACVCVGGG